MNKLKPGNNQEGNSKWQRIKNYIKYTLLRLRVGWPSDTRSFENMMTSYQKIPPLKSELWPPILAFCDKTPLPKGWQPIELLEKKEGFYFLVGWQDVSNLAFPRNCGPFSVASFYRSMQTGELELSIQNGYPISNKTLEHVPPTHFMLIEVSPKGNSK